MRFSRAISGVLITLIDARFEYDLKCSSVMSFACSLIVLLYMDNKGMRCCDRREPKVASQWAMILEYCDVIGAYALRA
jgi:hypothetical protein